MKSIRQLECAIVKGDINRATALTGKCLREGLRPSLIIEQGILRAMEIVGKNGRPANILSKRRKSDDAEVVLSHLQTRGDLYKERELIDLS